MKNLLAPWLSAVLSCSVPPDAITPLPNDASFRRYFRVKHGDGSVIAVHAPIDKEQNTAFVQVAQLLQHQGLCVPQILAYDPKQGFFCLSDLGKDRVADVTHSCTQQVLHTLVAMQQIPPRGLPEYDAVLLSRELGYFRTWFLEKEAKVVLNPKEEAALNHLFGVLIEVALGQPKVFVHRDYHCRNLMWLQDDPRAIGLLDFQDAVVGPLTYDVVSFLKDAYVDWSADQVMGWLHAYHVLSIDQGLIHPKAVPFSTLVMWFDYMGLHRHLKILGIFARLYHRDGKKQYLQYLPRVCAYIASFCVKYPKFQRIEQLIHQAQDKGLD